MGDQERLVLSRAGLLGMCAQPCGSYGDEDPRDSADPLSSLTLWPARQLGLHRRSTQQAQTDCFPLLKDGCPSCILGSTWYIHHQLCTCVQLSATLWYPIERSPPGSSVHGILQARIREWVAIISSRGSSRPRDGTCLSCVSCIGRRVLYHWATWDALSITTAKPKGSGGDVSSLQGSERTSDAHQNSTHITASLASNWDLLVWTSGQHPKKSGY